MDPSDPNVIEPLHLISHDFRSDDRFLRHRNVAGACRNNSYGSLPILSRILAKNNGARKFPIFCFANFLFYRRKLLRRGVSSKDVALVLGEASEDLGDLRRRFPLSEHDLGHAHTNRPMMVHLGKAEVFKWQMPKTINGFVGRQLPRSDLLKQLSNG